MRDFRKLEIWRRSHALSVRVHRLLTDARGIPADRRDQLRRSISSIPDNISEGCGKRSELEFARFLDIALGSSTEAENHLVFARELAWLDGDAVDAMLDELVQVRKMTFVFARAVRARQGATMR